MGLAISKGGIFFCGDGIEPCAFCGDVASALCDYPVGRRQRCDTYLCENCRIQQGGEIRDIDFCPSHALIALGTVTGPKVDAPSP